MEFPFHRLSAKKLIKLYNQNFLHISWKKHLHFAGENEGRKKFSTFAGFGYKRNTSSPTCLGFHPLS